MHGLHFVPDPDQDRLVDANGNHPPGLYYIPGVGLLAVAENGRTSALIRNWHASMDIGAKYPGQLRQWLGAVRVRLTEGPRDDQPTV